MTKKFLLVGIILALVVTFAGCVRRPTIQVDYGPRLDAIEARLEKIEQAIEELKVEEQEFTKATTNDEILYENMEQLYKEVDELRAKMGMPLSKPRRVLVK